MGREWLKFERDGVFRSFRSGWPGPNLARICDGSGSFEKRPKLSLTPYLRHNNSNLNLSSTLTLSFPSLLSPP